MNMPGLSEQDAEVAAESDDVLSEPPSEPVEIEADELQRIVGAGDGTAMGLGRN